MKRHFIHLINSALKIFPLSPGQGRPSMVSWMNTPSANPAATNPAPSTFFFPTPATGSDRAGERYGLHFHFCWLFICLLFSLFFFLKKSLIHVFCSMWQIISNREMQCLWFWQNKMPALAYFSFEHLLDTRHVDWASGLLDNTSRLGLGWSIRSYS